MPEDFREYLLRSCPVGGNWDNADCTWWPLDRIKNIPDEYEQHIKNAEVAKHSNSYLFFADHCIWCGAWAIACGEDENRGRLVFVDGGHDLFVAKDFAQFVERYIADWRSISYGK